MVRKWVAGGVLAIMVVLAGCSSDGGSSAFHAPNLAGRNWTPAGLATAHATVDAIARGLPGQCADAGVSDFSRLAFGMEQVRSRVVPTAQMTCNVNDEVVEVSVFANQRDRDRFVSDRSAGLCRLAIAQAAKYKKAFTFPGLRWDVGAGNVTVQPDSQTLARRLSVITGGHYDGRGCGNGITADWNSRAIDAIDALGGRVSTAGHGCPSVNLVPRESLDQSRKLTDAQLPAAFGNCAFDGTSLALITYVRATPEVKKFVDQRTRALCAGDSGLGRIDGDGFTVLAAGTVAEQVQAVVGGKLAATSCG